MYLIDLYGNEGKQYVEYLYLFHNNNIVEKKCSLESQQSRLSWMFLTVFVRRFLPGLNDVTIFSISWILQTYQNINSQ